jgi:hypothetical protein
MGYQDITLYRLKFENRDGLEVTVEGLSTGDMLGLMDLMAKLPDGTGKAKGLTPEMRPVIESMMETLAGALDEWNIEDRKGQPVPLTLDGLKSLKLELVMDVITAWINAQATVDPTSPPGSGDGGTAAGLTESSIPMTSPGS